jgi:hypothetical protein
VEAEVMLKRDPLWIELLTLFGMSAGLIALIAMTAVNIGNGDIPWTTVAIIGGGIALLFLPKPWTEPFVLAARWTILLAAKCILGIALAVVGLVVVAFALSGISTINFNAPLTLGGGIVIAWIVILAMSSQRT